MISPPPNAAAATGYLHPGYAESLAEFGLPLALPRSGGHLLLRPIPGTDAHDAMGCYPLCCCRDWAGLRADLAELRDQLVSVTLVTDPFGAYDEVLLRSTFDRVLAYKQHFAADLGKRWEEFTSARHRKYGRKARQQIAVEVCADPGARLEEWVALYAHLTERHGITGLRAFSRAAFARQLAVPGMVMFRATAGGETLSLDLWYVQGEVAQAHLVGTSPRGYELQVSYGLKLFILQYFTGKVRWLNLGAGAGLAASPGNGLTEFKRGWTSGTRPAYLCGLTLNAARYDEISRARGVLPTDYFPAYRKNEFT